MSFSYSGNPATSPADEIRFLLQDITEPGLLQDQDIAYYMAKLDGTFSDPLMTAAFLADVIAIQYAGEVSISADGVTYSGEQLWDKYRAVAASLRSTYNLLRGQGAEPYGGGSDLVTAGPYPGTVPLNFGIGLLDNMRAGLQRYGYIGEIALGEYEADLDPANYQP